MGLHRNYDDHSSNTDFGYEENPEELHHKREVRRMLEDRLERNRLKKELEDEFDDEFDWSEIDR